jgi:hypothetical protein
MPSPLQCMMLADGCCAKVPVYSKTWICGNVYPSWPLSFTPTAPLKGDAPTVNSKMARAWIDGAKDVWRQHGVWQLHDAGSISCNHSYFSVFPPHHDRNGQKVDFMSGATLKCFLFPRLLAFQSFALSRTFRFLQSFHRHIARLHSRR